MSRREIETWPTRGEAARTLGISPERVTQLLNAGALAYVETRLGKLINPDSLARMQRAREAKAGTE
jgi:hypothetical protein